MDVIDRDLTIHELEAFRESCIANLLRMSFDDIKDVVKDIPAVNRWIPVEDALPEENVRCLVYTEGGGYGISHRMGRNLEKWDCLGLQVTHWMPLPEPPESEVQDDEPE